MATSVNRMRAHRERERRGIRRLTIDVSQAISARSRDAATKGLEAPTPMFRPLEAIIARANDDPNLGGCRGMGDQGRGRALGGEPALILSEL